MISSNCQEFSALNRHMVSREKPTPHCICSHHNHKFSLPFTRRNIDFVNCSAFAYEICNNNIVWDRYGVCDGPSCFHCKMIKVGFSRSRSIYLKKNTYKLIFDRCPYIPYFLTIMIKRFHSVMSLGTQYTEA